MKGIIEFTKMVAAGNDFVVIEDSTKASGAELSALAKKICDRKFGIGADGVLLIGKSKKADARMRIFNADGSEAEMCGNGARCAVFWVGRASSSKSKNIKLETKAGIVESEANGSIIKIKLTEPKDIKVNFSIKVNGRALKVNFVNTGVPHTVIFAQCIDNIDVDGLGRAIRNHPEFAPKGTNVNFVEIVNDNFIRVRTYERGVEAETLACGTGSSASAVIAGFRLDKIGSNVIKVETRSGEVLKVYFKRDSTKVENVWLEGKAQAVFSGKYAI